MSLLEVNNLTIAFGGLVAVDDLSFTMERGQITSLIGPNGAGKTTVINMLTGFYTPDSGEVKLDGELTKGWDTTQYVRKGFNRTFQNIRLFSNLTVEDNILIGTVFLTAAFCPCSPTRSRIPARGKPEKK